MRSAFENRILDCVYRRDIYGEQLLRAWRVRGGVPFNRALFGCAD